MPWDAQKSSANTNDLRGKILPSIPSLTGATRSPRGTSSPGMAKTRPEIYTTGHRNPYRIAVDKHTGVLYWGDVGPDALGRSGRSRPRRLRRGGASDACWQLRVAALRRRQQGVPRRRLRDDAHRTAVRSPASA
ncbi:MAG: PQQ-dependent sugar dehydrogenase [Gemmatimonadetes bacterium]|nr:PQQ-dependent sugar dehydrogenase [Gemmatimonadota bacterium]